MKKQVLACVLAAAMVLGCAAPAMAEEAGQKPYTIAVPFPESGDVAYEIMRSNMDLLGEQTNGTLINAAADLTADGVLSFVESQVAAGVDGLVICPPSDSVLPTVTTLCEEAGVYWAISLRSISDPEIKEMVESSPYYVGNCYEDEYTAGYTCGQWMGEQGYKKIAIISQAKGDTTCDTREEGLAQACEEYGMEVVAESRGLTQASDATSAVESFLAANADLDAVFFVGTSISGSQEAAIKAIQDAGREEVKLVCIDFPPEMTEDFESGILAYAYAQVCLTYDPYIAILKVVNAIEGTPLDDSGAPTSNTMAMYAIDNAEDASEYQNVTNNPAYLFYDEEQLPSLYKWENPDLNEETLQEMVDNYSVN